MTESFAVVVPWVREAQRDAFLEAWCIGSDPEWLILQRDAKREGCGVTKNKGIAEAIHRGASLVVVLDDDCYPDTIHYLPDFVAAHREALGPQPVEMFEEVASPPSRGTPYGDTTVTLPVAASMGFWTEVGDYCAVRQLAHEAMPMEFYRQVIYGRYFPLSGMNVAFRPAEWLPWCQFIDVPRFDDIWMGWLWQREAYRRGYCFSLLGPTVRHARQSDVWHNLAQEAVYLERNEMLWREIATHPFSDYPILRGLLPV